MKRIVAFMLCVAMLFTMVPGLTISSHASEGVDIYYNGNAQENVILPKGGDIELNAVKSVYGDVAYQWQIDISDNVWVDISGETGADIRVSYAMIANVLSGNVAKIRCEMVCGGEIIDSDPVIITVSEANSNAAVAIPEEDDAIDMVQPTPITSVPDTTVVDTDSASTDASSEADEPSSGTEIVLPDDEVSGGNAEDEPSIATFEARAASVNAVADEPVETVNIVINYVFQNGEVAAQPYTANVAKGSDFSAVVNSPEVLGYLPYEGEDATVSTSAVTLNYTNIQADQTITVFYKPTLVNYTIIYKLQNLDGNGYTEDVDSREVRQGLTDSVVEPVDKNFDGFSMLWYDTPTIAADGSTVVEVYYDRNFYLMLFELDGGYGVDPIYAHYGSAVSVATPTKAGYTFTGWSPEVPETIPVNGGTYTAQWQAADTAKVSVVFWGENPNDEEYSYVRTGVLELQPGTEYTYTEGSTAFIICGKEQHTHTADCGPDCGKEEHTEHTEECLTCTHTHTLSCYQTSDYYTLKESTPDQTITATRDGVYTYTRYGITRYYLYLNGTWYCYYDNYFVGKSDTQSISIGCGHEHTTDCYGCEYHAHALACYSCGKEAHVHDSSCNQTGSGMDSTLWTFVKSDTVVVAADGSSVINVYYDRTTFTMTFKETGYNGDTLDTITDKWGADIKERFEDISEEHTFLWSAESDGSDPWTSFMDVMPAENRTYYAYTTSSDTTHTGTYLALKIGGTAGVTADYETLYTVSVKYGSRLTVTDEEYIEIEGFTFNANLSTAIGSTYNGAKFYYDRNTYNIEFYSPITLLKTVNNVPYQSPLTSYDWTPTSAQAPAQYEPGSVEFAGWYLNPECTGEEYDFSQHTMPVGTENGATSLTLYAKWLPVNHNVNIYLSSTDAENGTNKIGETLVVPHGDKVDEADIPATPPNGDLNFVGWFYMDNGVEKAFDFNNMPVNKDLTIYAKWSDTAIVSYIVYYRAKDAQGNVINDANGNPIELADPTTGQALTGISRTFEAKASEELLEGYQEGYFPQTKSHTMVLETGGSNSYIFYYVPVDAVPYTVRYLHEDGTPMETDVNGFEILKYVPNNRKAVVTENFKVFPGYMPDAYQKRLVVSADGKDNVIIFYYVEDNEHAYYRLTHLTENIDGDYTEYSSSEAIGDVGRTYDAQPMTINGFTYDATKTEIVVNSTTTLGTSATLTTQGLEIRHYYTRNSYPYEVHYLELETGKELADPKTGMTGKYGEIVSENAIAISGYECITPSPSTLKILIESDENNIQRNIINFYYKEAEVDITYKVVGPAEVTDFGTVDLNDGDATGALTETTETVKALSGTALGATAVAGSNAYRFVGWYSDAACTQLVSEDASYVPAKPADGVWKEATYYAKFEYNLTSMTISKTVTAAEGSYDTSDTFIFDVVGSDGSEFSVSLKAGESKTITGVTVGVTYTVTERTNWSSRYDNTASPEAKALVADATQNVYAFENKLTESKWLSVSQVEKNEFNKYE